MFNSSVSRRRILQGAAGAFAVRGAVALAQNSNTTRYRFAGKDMAAQELLSNGNFNAEEEPVYVVTDHSPGAPIEVFGSFEEVRDAFAGTALSGTLGQIDDNIRTAQKLQPNLSGADIRRMQRDYAMIEHRQAEVAAETGLKTGSLEMHARERSNGISIGPRWNAGTLWENDNYDGRSTSLIAIMPDAALVNFDNIASSLRYSGAALFSDISWYRGSKLLLVSFTIQSVPSLNAYQTPHGVSWNDLISSWTVLSF